MIAFNMQPLAVPELTGIGYYTSNVARELFPLTDEYEVHAFDFTGRNGADASLIKHLGDAVDPTRIKLIKQMPLSAYIRLGNAGKLYSYEKLTDSSAELTVFFNYLIPEGLTGRSIITIYDMVCKRFPETMDDRNRRLLQRHLQSSADRAEAVMTISEFSKREIHELLGVPEKRIFVAQCGVDNDFYSPFASDEERDTGIAEVKKFYGTDNYILYVGTLEPRKNVGTLVEAFDRIAGKYTDTSLILAGGLGWQPDVTLSAIEASRYKDRIIRTGYISDEIKRLLYRCAACFVFPSIYEGFGMPVTEAMACGIPCVISSASSLPEAGGGHALMCAPDDAVGFAERMDLLLSGSASSSYVDSLELRKTASRYTWTHAAKVYKSAINSVCNNSML